MPRPVAFYKVRLRAGGPVKRCICGHENHRTWKVCRGCWGTLRKRPKGKSHRPETTAKIQKAERKMEHWKTALSLAATKFDYYYARVRALQRQLAKEVGQAKEGGGRAIRVRE